MKELNKGISSFVFTLSLCSIFLSTFLIFNGFHSIDLAWNVYKISYEENLRLPDNYVDCSIGNVCEPYDKIYVDGWLQIFLGFGLLMFCFLLINYFFYIYLG